MSIPDKKISQIPIGLDYHTIYNNKVYWAKTKQTPVTQEKVIFDLLKDAKPFYERSLKAYCNFLHAIRGRYGLSDRSLALNQINHKLLYFEEQQVTRDVSWKNMISCAFVLSPLGNGLDCHRTWEALVLGCIPIVKTSVLDPLYHDLPVLIVENWFDVTEELLKATLIFFRNKPFNYKKLTLQYWVNVIKSYTIY